MFRHLKTRVINGYKITRREAENLLKEDLDELAEAADEIRRARCGPVFDFCAIINARSGRCSENCRFCAQSSHYPTAVGNYKLLSGAQIAEAAERHHRAGIPRFSVVTSGRALPDGEVDDLCRILANIRRHNPISLCASNGLLTPGQFRKLREAGVSRYHNNLETSRRFFPRICTSHTYDDKIKAIRDAMEAGLTVCSGGIIGLGEDMADRVDMAFELRELGVRSVPVNILNPIKNTPLEKMVAPTADEIKRVVAVFRFILPDAALRLAGGRGLLPDRGAGAFCSGANAAITGDMLTTAGVGIQTDKEMVERLGFEVGR